MRDSNSSPGGGPAWQMPTLVVAVLAIFGLQMSGSKPATRAKDETQIATDQSAEPVAEASGFDRILLEFEPLTADRRLAILEPLLRFHAPYLNRARKEKLAAEAAQRSRANGEEAADIGPIAGDAKNAGIQAARHEDDRLLALLIEKIKKDVDNATASARTKDDAQTDWAFRVIIGIVPDPVNSGISYRYDNSIFGIQSAFAEHGFVLDSHSIPWASKSSASSKPAPRPETDKRGSDTQKGSANRNSGTRDPGVLLFRRIKRSEDSKRSADSLFDEHNRTDLAMVLLVPETPIKGIDSAVFHKALDVSEMLITSTMPEYFRTNDLPPPPIRVVGPNFSGSDASMLRSVDHWLDNPPRLPDGSSKAKNERPQIRWFNGPAAKLSTELSGDFPPTSRYFGRVHFVTYTATAAAIQNALIEFTKSQLAPWDWNHRVAFVSEGTTLYGSFNRRKVFDDQIERFYYKYPLNIAELRMRIEKAKDSETKPTVQIQTSERIQLEINEAGERNEAIPLAAQELTVATDEQRLLRIAEDINQRKIRFVIISSSDVRDLIFVAEFLEKYCPNSQLLTSNYDISLNHTERITKLRGIINASSSVTYPGEQTTVPGDGSESTNSNARSGTIFPDGVSTTMYVSTYKHLKESDLIEATGNSGKNMPLPPIRISTNSQKGFLPLGTFVYEREEGDSSAAAVRKWVADGAVRHRLLTSGVSAFLPMIFFVLGLGVLYWYRARFVNADMHLDHEHKFLFGLPNDGKNDEPQTGAADNKPERRQRNPKKAGTKQTSEPIPRYPEYAVRLQESAASLSRYLKDRSDFRKYFSGRLTLATAREWAAPVLLLFGFEIFLQWGSPDNVEDRVKVFLSVVFCLVLAIFTPRLRNWAIGPAIPRAIADESAYVEVIRLTGIYLTMTLAFFLILEVSTFEPVWLESILIMMIMSALVGVVFLTIQMNRIWDLFSSLTTNIQGLPIGDALERLPRRLTSRPGDINETWFDSNDGELKSRIHHLAVLTMNQIADAVKAQSQPAATQQNLPAITPISPELAELARTPPREENDYFKFSRAVVLHLLKPEWDRRMAIDAYGDSDERAGSKTDKADGTPRPADMIRQAETLVAVMLVRYVNRGLDLVWTMIISTISLTLIMMSLINSYPFQPAGKLSSWMLLIIAGALVSCFRIYFGINRDGVLSRVHRVPSGRSVFNFDFLGKGLLYLAPLLTVLSAMSMGVSELFRILLMPLFS